MNRVPELEALNREDDVSVADRNNARKQYLGMGLFAFAGFCVLALYLSSSKTVQKDLLDGDEEFSTTSFRAPSFLRDKEPEPEKPADNILKLPEPPAPPPPVAVNEFDVPPPPVVTPPAPEPAMLAPEAPKEDPFPSRFKSSQIVMDAANGAAGASGSSAGTSDTTETGSTDSRSKFLASVSSSPDRAATARQINRIDAMVPEGTMIAGILETAINSDLPGQIRAITSGDVYSFDGRRVLIPAGSRLIGEYQSELTTGQTRIFIVWTRLIREDGVSIRLNSIGADGLGRAGVTGFVDKKFRERFGAAIMLSIVGGVTDFVAGLSDDALGVTSATALDAAAIARENLAQTFSDMANQALAEQLKIPPTVHIDQGTRIFVYVRQDLDFSGLYKDPVTEELEAIKHERGLK